MAEMVLLVFILVIQGVIVGMYVSDALHGRGREEKR